MSIQKPAVRAAWADTAIPTTDIVDPGTSFVPAGWQESDTPPARQYFNWILNYCMNGIRYYCRRGLPDYDSAETYAANDIVRGDDNNLYQSLSAGNIAHTPSTSGTYWALLPYVTPATLATDLAAYATLVDIAPLATSAALASLSAAVSADVTAIDAAIALLAPKANPTLTGTPAAPTAPPGTSTTQLATTAFVAAAVGAIPLFRSGVTGTLSGGANTITFATPFPASCTTVVISPYGNSASFAVTSINRFGFTMNTGASTPFTYIATGA